MFLDELAAGLDLVAHEDAEKIVGCPGIVHGDPQERAVGGGEGRVAELLGVHFPQSLEARDLHALFAAAPHGGQQPTEVLQPDAALAAAQDITRVLHTGPLLGNQAIDLKAHFPQVGQVRID